METSGRPDPQINFINRQQAPPSMERTTREMLGGPMRYPIEGESFITEIQESPETEFPRVLERSLAYSEGLRFSILYNPADVEQRVWWMNLCTTVESSTDRPNAYYVMQALNERIDKKTRDIIKKHEDAGSEPSPEEWKEFSKYVGFANWKNARNLLDRAFIQRQQTCSSEKPAAEMVDHDKHFGDPVSPDKGHWQAIFGVKQEGIQHEFGEKVDRVLRGIVAAGMDENCIEFAQVKKYMEEKGIPLPERSKIKSSIYATGFESTEQFNNWLTYLRGIAGGRMDDVWFAWRVAEAWELPSLLGLRIDDKGKYDIGAPPIVGALFAYSIHIFEKRMLEYGLDSSGKRFRQTKWISHSGAPYSIRIGNLVKEDGERLRLCSDFLHESTLKWNGVDRVSLWKIWWSGDTDNKGISFADPKFPWMKTEEGGGNDEVLPGGYGSWLLTRSRAESMIKDLKEIFSLKDLAEPKFFVDKARTWSKVLGEIKDNTLPENNPRAIALVGWLLPYHKEDDGYIPFYKQGQNKELKFRATSAKDQRWGLRRPGIQTEDRSVSVYDILRNAQECNFIRVQDASWIMKVLNIAEL